MERYAEEKVETELKLSAKDAGSVAVGGTFNGWQPALSPLVRGSDGVWRTRLSLAPGRYEYRFVVDGKWIDDPLAKDSVPNPYGGRNSVLSVEAPSAKSAYAGAW
jgi:1,4-alpha-glucan branching enzyme